MFWNGNFTVVREISSLLKDENVTLTQLIEADDILQECDAELKPLVAFLTRPEVVAELVGLITEEPSKNVELQSQYRYSAMAAEILTSGIGALKDRLSADTLQMNRLFDFLNQEAPLNPLLASFFSKTVRCLLEQSHKQDWYTYNIIGLRAMDFLRSRSDFLPNLYRHIGTSAICDLFKYFIRLDLFTKVILEWFEAHHFLEVLIQMICGTYVAEELPAPASPASPASPAAPAAAPALAAGSEGASEKADPSKEVNGENGEQEGETHDERDKGSEDVEAAVRREAETRAARVAAGRSAQAASLMCEIVLTGCYGEGCTGRPETGARLMAWCRSEPLVNLLLQSMFTSPPEFRRHAVVNGVHVLLQLLQDDPVSSEEVNAESRRAVVSAVAPHLPLLHQTLLQEPPPYPHAPQSRKCVGMARLQVATLVASLTGAPAEEVPRALVALGTLATLLDLFFGCPGNNFLHAQTYRAIASALHNAPYRAQYARHLIIECDLLKRLMDVFEENYEKEGRAARSGYMGHVILLLELLQQVLDERLYEEARVPDELGVRWAHFKEDKMHPLYRETPLGGVHPAETTFETEALAEGTNFDYNGAAGGAEGGGGEGPELPDDNASDDVFDKFYSNYQYHQDQYDKYTARRGRREADDLPDADSDRQWDDDYEDLKEAKSPKFPGEILDVVSPWEAAGAEGAEAATGSEGAAEGWAQFSSAEDNDKFGGFVSVRPEEFAAFWDAAAPAAARPPDLELEPSGEHAAALQRAMRDLSVGAAPAAEVEGAEVAEVAGVAGVDVFAPPHYIRPFDEHLDNIEKAVEEQCEPMDLADDPEPAPAAAAPALPAAAAPAPAPAGAAER